MRRKLLRFVDLRVHVATENPRSGDYWLTALAGFLFDTTLAAGKLVFSGVVTRFPRITWVLGHLGGTVPYVAERWDRGYRAFKECRVNIDQPPSEYLKKFYYDSVNFDVNALMNAIADGADQRKTDSDLFLIRVHPRQSAAKFTF
jgi:predicted TIM-barrel fold metal-dependent hydrolase